jgi:hypothetical protein
MEVKQMPADDQVLLSDSGDDFQKA